MDPIRNPYAPGAGTSPLELAGRDDVLANAKITLERLKIGRAGRSQLMLGPRGVGKTVLLNKVFHAAETSQYFTILSEAPESGNFLQRVLPDLKRIHLQLSTVDSVKDKLTNAWVATRNLAAAFKLSYEGFEFGVTQPGLAQSGDFETDFAEVMRLTLLAAQSAGRQIAFFVDEVQYLSKEELTALVVCCHDANQRGLPFVLFGAGLPQIAKLAGDAKSYSERLFEFPEIGALGNTEGRRALAKPAESEGVEFTEDAIALILRQSETYPYFIQEWGHHVWNAAKQSPIDAQTVRDCYDTIIAHLDQSFFRVRFDRCKPVQQKYLRAMAELGPGPHQTGDIARVLQCAPSQVATTRQQLINLGMIWSLRHGETAFTVPLFDEFMKRQMPDVVPHTPKARKKS
ncbi:MAG: ATP-binding protein [Pseudomonadota bacterium]